MNKKLYYFLLIILALNTLRYGMYLIQGDVNLYYIIFFIFNLIALIVGFFAKDRILSDKRSTNNISQ